MTHRFPRRRTLQRVFAVGLSDAHTPDAKAIARAPVAERQAVVSRTRILSWRKDSAGDLLPVTAFGVVDKRAFVPSPTRPEDGFCFIECHCGSDGREWVSPFKASLRLTDAHVRSLLHNEPAKPKHAPPMGPTRTSPVTQPSAQPLSLPAQRAMATIKRHYATQAQQQQQKRSSTVQLRREIDALKKRYE